MLEVMVYLPFIIIIPDGSKIAFSFYFVPVLYTMLLIYSSCELFSSNIYGIVALIYVISFSAFMVLAVIQVVQHVK